MKWLYSFLVELLRFGLWFGAFFNEKLKKGWQGRKESWSEIKKISSEDKVIWMHAASLGEYEQGLPVLSTLKEKFPNHKILITFFSPSGYENVVQKTQIADVVCYLPLDRKSEIRRFLNAINVQVFFTIKYDYWYHLLAELKERKIPVFVVSALFYPKQIFFKPIGTYFVRQLKTNVDWFFHQTENSFELAKSIGLRNSSISGDTRYDRVRENFKNAEEIPFIKEFIGEEKCVVFGSSWEAEEKIAQLLSQKSEVKIIIAPHDLKRVKHLQQLFPEALLYSENQESRAKSKTQNSKLLIIDCIGLLSKLYAYADVSVVGGGFHSAGLHNILESAVFGNPVLFGNQYQNHPEADDLIAANGAQSFSTENSLVEEILFLLKDEEKRLKMSQNAKNFIFNQPNSSEMIVSEMVLKMKN